MLLHTRRALLEAIAHEGERLHVLVGQLLGTLYNRDGEDDFSGYMFTLAFVALTNSLVRTCARSAGKALTA